MNPQLVAEWIATDPKMYMAAVQALTLLERLKFVASASHDSEITACIASLLKALDQARCV